MKFETILDHHTIFENRRPEVFFAVRCIAQPGDAGGRAFDPAPKAYCVALDRSASVGDGIFTLARRFVSEMIRHLPAGALFSVVTFHETAEAVFDLGVAHDKGSLRALVDSLEPVDNGTNLSAALLLAREQLSHAPATVGSKKIILLTDGEHTAGIRDEAILTQIATDCRGQGIEISSIHLSDTNADFVRQISSNYRSGFRSKNILKTVSEEMGGLQPLAVQNVRVRLKPLEFCDRVEPLGFDFTERSDGWLTYAIGDLLAGEERTVCFNLTIPLLPCIDDKPFASLANEALLELEAGYELVNATSVTPKVFATTVRIPAISNTTYPTSEDGSLSLRDGG